MWKSILRYIINYIGEHCALELAAKNNSDQIDYK